MRLPDMVTNTVEFTSPSALKAGLLAEAAARKHAVDPKDIDEWVALTAEGLRRIGRLMTDTQYADHKSGRMLMPKDRAVFIAEDRVEKAENGTTTIRPKGQLGTIKDSRLANDGLISIVFQPDEPQHAPAGTEGPSVIVHLSAFVQPCGWPLVERIPAPDASA